MLLVQNQLWSDRKNSISVVALEPECKIKQYNSRHMLLQKLECFTTESTTYLKTAAVNIFDLVAISAFKNALYWLLRVSSICVCVKCFPNNEFKVWYRVC